MHPAIDETILPAGKSLPTLDSARLRLRHLHEADVPALFAIFGNPEVTRFWGFPTLPDPAAATALLADIHAHFSKKSLFQWGLALAGTDAIIGTCTLAALDPANRRAELGFALAQAHWGQGYMSEALPTLLEHAFSSMRLHRITADADPKNAPSIRILERLGFRPEGLLRQHYLIQGYPQDAAIFGILRSEWRYPGAPEDR